MDEAICVGTVFISSTIALIIFVLGGATAADIRWDRGHGFLVDGPEAPISPPWNLRQSQSRASSPPAIPVMAAMPVMAAAAIKSEPAIKTEPVFVKVEPAK